MSLTPSAIFRLVRERVPGVSAETWREVRSAGYYACDLGGRRRAVMVDMTAPLVYGMAAMNWTEDMVAAHVAQELPK